MTMLEKAARELEEANVDWSSDGRDGHKAQGTVRRECVRIVLRAIREPDEAMIEAGNWNPTEGTSLSFATIGWQAMIDAILAEGEGE